MTVHVVDFHTARIANSTRRRYNTVAHMNIPLLRVSDQSHLGPAVLQYRVETAAS